MISELLYRIKQNESNIQGFGINVTSTSKIFELTLFLSGGEVFKINIPSSTIESVTELCNNILDNKS